MLTWGKVLFLCRGYNPAHTLGRDSAGSCEWKGLAVPYSQSYLSDDHTGHSAQNMAPAQHGSANRKHFRSRKRVDRRDIHRSPLCFSRGIVSSAPRVFRVFPRPSPGFPGFSPRVFWSCRNVRTKRTMRTKSPGWGSLSP
jgi:hypothetical protein